jgi:hypothetical protein
MLTTVQMFVVFVTSGVIKKATGERESAETVYSGMDHTLPILVINI